MDVDGSDGMDIDSEGVSSDLPKGECLFLAIQGSTQPAIIVTNGNAVQSPLELSKADPGAAASEY
jgi:hypothetical protein